LTLLTTLIFFSFFFSLFLLSSISSLFLGEIPSDESFSSIVVKTTVTAQLECLMDLLITHNYPPLIIGPTGTGKSTVIARMLNKTLPQEMYRPIMLAFTAKTTAAQWQTIVDAK
jgi:dynein heavy chain